MCLCEGKGSVVTENKGVIQWHNCPDSHCTFDKAAAERRWLKVKQDIRELEEKAKRDVVVS